MKAERHRREVSEILNAIRLIQGVGQRQTQEFVRKYGITGQQLGTLRIIDMSPQISLRDLSARVYLHVSTVSGIVDRLVKRGFVTRTRSAEDRRRIELIVTTAGRRVVRRTPLAGMGLLFHNADKLPARQLQDILKGLRLLLKMMKLRSGRNRQA